MCGWNNTHLLTMGKMRLLVDSCEVHAFLFTFTMFLSYIEIIPSAADTVDFNDPYPAVRTLLKIECFRVNANEEISLSK